MRALFTSLFLCLSLSLWASPPAPSSPPPSLPIYASELTHSREIAARLLILSASLQGQLATSEASLIRLSEELTALRVELEELRRRLESSRVRLTELEAALAKSEASLASLTESFAAYRIEAEPRIKSLERDKIRLKWVAALGIGTGAALGLWGLTR